MEAQQQPSAKELMDGVKAVNEMMDLFKTSEAKLGELMPSFVSAVEGNHLAWFEGMGKVADLDVDDAQGALIVALGILAKVKVKTRDTPAEQAVKEAFQRKES